jgi:hypothetical protein
VTLTPDAPPVTVPGNTVASFSDLGRFGQCRRAWWLGTYRRLRRIDEPPTGPLPFGSRIHSALEAFYDGTVADPTTAWKALMSHEYAVDAANGSWHITDLDRESKLGHRMLEGYLEWLEAEGEDAAWDVIGVESKLHHWVTLTIQIDGVPHEVAVLFRGKIDRRLRRKSDGALYVGDFKTVQNFGEPAMLALELSPQGPMYAMLERQQDPSSDVRGVVYTLLRKVLRNPTAKPPFYKRLTVEINAATADAYKIRLIGAVEQLAQARVRLDRDEDPARVAFFQPGWWCSTCPFKLPCGLMQHTPESAEAMLDDLYTETDPWARYLTGQGEETEPGANPNGG